MSRIVHEKFQVRVPQNKSDEESGWVGDKSSRTKKGLAPASNTKPYNDLPPGMVIGSQDLSDQHSMTYAMAGTTDVSHDTNAESLRRGFKRKKMLTTDDEYTNEHTDIFYGEVTVDGDTGFVERANLLDRH